MKPKMELSVAALWGAGRGGGGGGGIEPFTPGRLHGLITLQDLPCKAANESRVAQCAYFDLQNQAAAHCTARHALWPPACW